MTTRAPTLELGVVGNCEVAALVDEHASIVWGCLPALDGDPVFCALLDGDCGDEPKSPITAAALLGSFFSLLRRMNK